MKANTPILFIEINNYEFFFIAGEENENNYFKILHKISVPLQGVRNYQITDFDLFFNIIKNNIYIIERELNFTFNDVILIIDNFNQSFVNLSGFKKLNGSQILKENITYILNSLKSNIDEFENKKTILHIFNSKYSLDKKKIDNIPVGLFGDLYSHELSFCLINNNDHKNLKNIFNKCNLRIKKILLKSFVECSFISNKDQKNHTFFLITINENKSQIIFFKDDALVFEQSFNFGSDLVVADVSKITFLNKEIVKNLISEEDLTNEDLIEKKYFKNENYRKIKKNLIFQIAKARIQEFSELIINKNINLISYHKKNTKIFLRISDKSMSKCIKESYNYFFSKNNYFKLEFIEDIETQDEMASANQLVHYGWKKEAIPVIHSEKSIIARFFDIIFN